VRVRVRVRVRVGVRVRVRVRVWARARVRVRVSVIAQLLLDHRDGGRLLEALDAVLHLRELDERGLGQHVGAHAHHLAHLSRVRHTRVSSRTASGLLG
jgi:hypothetical protein